MGTLVLLERFPHRLPMKTEVFFSAKSGWGNINIASKHESLIHPDAPARGIKRLVPSKYCKNCGILAISIVIPQTGGWGRSVLGFRDQNTWLPL